MKEAIRQFIEYIENRHHHELKPVKEYQALKASIEDRLGAGDSITYSPEILNCPNCSEGNQYTHPHRCKKHQYAGELKCLAVRKE